MTVEELIEELRAIDTPMMEVVIHSGVVFETIRSIGQITIEDTDEQHLDIVGKKFIHLKRGELK